eukprot:gene30952-38252_t
MVLGTHTSSGEQNHLLIAEVLLPSQDAPIDARKFDEEKGEVSPSSVVNVFDYSKHPSQPTDNVCRPQYRLHGHSAEGYGLCWNPLTEGRLLSGSDDHNICIWDVYGAKVDINALQTRTGHTSVVEDVDWSKHQSHFFGSVGDDSQLLLWDCREGGKPSQSRPGAHNGDVNCLAFNTHNEFRLITGGSDHLVHMWDLRNLTEPVHTFEGHENGVYQVSWAPFSEEGEIFASCGSDGKLHIWDASKIGAEQSAEDAEDGPPELKFIHSGHCAKISDFSWNANDHWTIASVSEDNALQIWQMTESIIYSDDEGDEDVNDEDLEGPEESGGNNDSSSAVPKERQ